MHGMIPVFVSCLHASPEDLSVLCGQHFYMSSPLPPWFIGLCQFPDCFLYAAQELARMKSTKDNPVWEDGDVVNESLPMCKLSFQSSGRRCPGHSRAKSSMNGQKFQQLPASPNAPGLMRCVSRWTIFEHDWSCDNQIWFVLPFCNPKTQANTATWRQVWTSFKTFYVSTTWPQGLSLRAFGTLLGMLLRGAPGWDFWLFTGRQHGQSVGSTGGCWRRPQTEIAGNGTIRDGWDLRIF